MSCLLSSGPEEPKLIFKISDAKKKKTSPHYKANTLKLPVGRFLFFLTEEYVSVTAEFL